MKVLSLESRLQPDKGQHARIAHLIDPKGFDDWLKAQPERHSAAAAAQGDIVPVLIEDADEHDLYGVVDR